MALVGIVAVDRHGAIGRGGELPWHYRADLRFFREQTLGHVCAMGRHTWRSIGKPLPGRLNVVLSRSGEQTSQPSVLWVPDRDAILSLAQFVRGDVFIIGGARTYALFAEDITRWVVTEVPLVVEDADVRMPEGFLAGFQLVDTRDLGEGLVAKFYDRNRGQVDELDGVGQLDKK